MITEYNYHYLLSQYRLIWKNRKLDAIESNSKDVLREAISRELLDENSHPRIRRSMLEKFYLAIKRITDSALSAEVKVELISLHIQIAEEIKLRNQS